MTPTSNAIAEFASKARLALPEEIKRKVLDPLREDPLRSETVAALITSGIAERLTLLLSGDEALAFVQLIAGATDNAGAEKMRQILRMNRQSLLWLFDVSYDLHSSYRRMGITRLAAPASTISPVVPTQKNAPFTGVGATGLSPRNVNVPMFDQFQMWRGDETTRQRYSNPLGDLVGYLRELTDEQRRRQGEILTGLPIVSCVPNSYAKLPTRRAILEAAARVHDLHAELIAAFILAEQRDQSQLEDGKDYTAATSPVRANTSIGLGQVVITTARKHDLFSDLLSATFRNKLSHTEIAFLLASDEFNVFAVAKYLRLTANLGAAASATGLPRTHATFPGLDLRAYAGNSRTWPAANIRALASEYTSAPWDDRVTKGWGDFVYEAYRDVTSRH